MGQIIKLFDETTLLRKLTVDTVQIIHLTNTIAAIKRLLHAHDMLHLTQEILDNYKSQFAEFVWDMPTISELDKVNRELIIYHRPDFKPIRRFDEYTTDLSKLISLAKKTSHR